ncbi:TRADD-N-associated membrane domain-containing protein [Vibrio comitans]|uniref:TRADD-N-associated membrane domain-containing protein n=1 Tax=Vibrio comitans TaxID=413401 RepID=UPI00353103E5
MEEYHSEVITQARISFWFSIISAAFEFCIIVYAFLSYSFENPDKPLIQFFLA